MIISERQNLILDRVIKEYINSAKPVSSQKLQKKYNFRIKPAMIRIEMQKLTDGGFLRQPHTSAGRIPTDKAYRFFVDKIFGEGFSDLKEDLEIEKWIDEEIEDSLKFIQKATRSLASASSSLAISYLLEDDVIWKDGWEEVLHEPEFQNTDLILNFTKLLKNFEKEIEEIKLNSEVKVYIGKENPFSGTKDFSMIISPCYWPHQEQGIISLLGPKRMDYNRNITLINHFRKILESL